jgi:predicted MPP superfamily phosphohydrolase
MMVSVFAGAAIYGFFIEPNWVKITPVRIQSKGLAEALRGKIAVQISDLHLHEIGNREKKVLKIVNGINPDFIFLTGDYIPWKGNVEPALEFLSRLKASIGIWAVMGDYDYSCSRMSCLFCHEPGSGRFTKRHKVRFLRNSVDQVHLPDEDIWIGALDTEGVQPFFSRDDPLPGKYHTPMIILAHDPLAFDLIDSERQVLVLAGDTHGGQIPLPSWLWALLGYEKVAKYGQGPFKEGRKEMYVSRGIGTSHLPLRILRRPEVVVIHFE